MAMNACDAFTMAIAYNTGRRSSICYDEDILHFFPHMGLGLGRASPHRWKSLEWISPNVKACGSEAAMKKMQLALDMSYGNCYYPSNATRFDTFPNDLGFPPGTEIVRWLDESNKALFLGIGCTSGAFLGSCVDSSRKIHQITRQWEEGGISKGRQKGAFCPPNGNLSLHMPDSYPYHCNSRRGQHCASAQR